jgi:hypothetical protein
MTSLKIAGFVFMKQQIVASHFRGNITLGHAAAAKIS